MPTGPCLLLKVAEAGDPTKKFWRLMFPEPQTRTLAGDVLDVLDVLTYSTRLMRLTNLGV